MKYHGNLIFKNRYGQVRSGWVILAVMASYYAILYLIYNVIMMALTNYLIYTGDINRSTGELSALVDWLNDTVLPVGSLILTDTVMIAVTVVSWIYIMKHSPHTLGLRAQTPGRHEAMAGMVLGFFNCSLIFVLVITVGGGHVTSWVPQFSVMALWWIFVFVLVAIAEELLNRGFLMAVLRRCRNICFIMVVPSVIFGLIHMANPDVTFFSIFNIVLVGILFSYMYIKSGNLWMCIGYHFTWNTFQGVIYGMPVSGLTIPGIFTTEFTSSNLLNGGGFGIEGGILTTIMTLVSFAFVWYYYRDSHYDFLTDTVPAPEKASMT